MIPLLSNAWHLYYDRDPPCRSCALPHCVSQRWFWRCFWGFPALQRTPNRLFFMLQKLQQWFMWHSDCLVALSAGKYAHWPFRSVLLEEHMVAVRVRNRKGFVRAALCRVHWLFYFALIWVLMGLTLWEVWFVFWLSKCHKYFHQLLKQNDLGSSWICWRLGIGAYSNVY